MAGLKAIKTKIRSIDKTQKVTKAMEAVSAAKMRKAQTTALAGRAYARAASAILARVSGSRELKNHPLTREANIFFSSSSSDAHEKNIFASQSEANPSLPRASYDEGGKEGFVQLNKALYIVITSDKGLAGALNSAVLRATLQDIAASGLSEEQVSIIAVGRKAKDFFEARGYEIAVYHPNTEDLSREMVAELVNEAATRFASGVVDIVKIAYQNFISTFEQRPTLRMMFPLSLTELEKVVGDITPARGEYAASAAAERPSGYTIEPSEEEVLGVIVPRLAGIFVHHALLESLASEHSARMVSMKSASDKAEELSHAFTLKFNKARQAAITREVSEITGGMEAMST